MKLVKVVWVDAEDFAEQTWVDRSDLESFKQADCEVESVGFLVSSTKKFVILAADAIRGGTLGRVTKIPRRMVKFITPIECPRSHPSS